MKHAGNARRAALRLILLTLAPVCAAGLLGLALSFAGGKAGLWSGLVELWTSILAGVWVLFSIFTCYFFRDPDARTPDGPGLVVCPGHGKIDAVDKLPDSPFPGGPC